MKVCQEIDVDNVTIVINQRNQLESQVVIEEVAGLTMPVTLTKDGKAYPVSKVGKLVGTDWLVFQVQEFIPPPTKETIRIPTSVFVRDISDPDSFESWNIKHRVAYTLTPENSAEFKAGKVSSNAMLEFKMIGRDNSNGSTVYVYLPADIEGKGEIEVNPVYGNGTTNSKIGSVIPSRAITVETEDKIYVYELISPVTVVNIGEMYPPPSFTVELDCGNYTWTEETEDQGQYLLGTATQPATITVVPTNFTADDIQEVRITLNDDSGYIVPDRNGLVITLSSEEYADVGATIYPICDAITVVFNNGEELRHDVRLECPITK